MSTLNTTKLDSEVSLLLSCANWYLDSSCQAKIQQLLKEKELDWEKIFKLAQSHRLLSLLYKVFSSFPASALPDGLLMYLHRRHLTNIGHNFSLLQELVKFLKILEAHHINAITFKGPMTAVNAYGDLSLRTFCDLDVLVHPDDFLKLRDIAVSHGYQCDRLMAPAERKCLKKLSPEAQELYFKSQKEFSIVNLENRVFLDIHQGILSKQFAPLFDTRWIWQHTQTVEIGGRQILGLKPEVQVLVLCAQGAEDNWTQLGKILDVAMLIKNHANLDWDALVDLSKKLDILPRLLLGLDLIRALYGVQLPDKVEKILDNDFLFIRRLSKAVQKNILLHNASCPESKLTISRAIQQLRLMRDWKNRMRFIRTLMTPTLADMATVSLPRPLFFMYYLLRPFRLIR